MWTTLSEFYHSYGVMGMTKITWKLVVTGWSGGEDTTEVAGQAGAPKDVPDWLAGQAALMIRTCTFVQGENCTDG